MPSERLPIVAVLALGLAPGCVEDKPPAQKPERFAGVKKAPSKVPAASSFCDKSYPASGEGTRHYAPAPLRPLGGTKAAPPAARGWRWVNVWATWCEPCVEEMALLNRWRGGLARDGLEVTFELLSVDESDREAELKAWRSRELPGPILWLRSDEDLGPFLDGLGIDRAAALPIHALVDGSGALRCVRVGAIHEQDYGLVRKLFAGE